MKKAKRNLSKPLSSTYGDDKPKKISYTREGKPYGRQDESPRQRKNNTPGQVMIQGTDTFELKGNPSSAWVHTNPKKAGLYNKYGEKKNPNRKSSAPDFSDTYMKYKKKR